MTPDVTAQAQQLLGAGGSPREVAEQLGIKLDTLRKAIQHGRLTVPSATQPAEPTPEETPAPQPPAATDKSTRAVEDATAEMGTACTRPDERVLAAFGLLDGASTRFETCRDVSFGGVLCALPALAANGLFRPHPRLPGKVTRLLQHAARDCPVGPHGAVPHQDRRAVAVPAAGRVGQAVGIGPRSGGSLSAAEAGRSVHRRRPAKMGRATGPRLAKGRAGAGRRPVCGRARSPLPRRTRPLCPNAMSPDSDCACGGPPTTGSTTLWASRSS